MPYRPLRTTPKFAPGDYPGKPFLEDKLGQGLRIGVITRVDDLNLKADVRVVTGGGERFEIDLTQAMCGPRSFWGGVPEKGSLVVLGFRPKHKQLQEVMILGYIPMGNKSGIRFDPYAPDDPATIAPEDASLFEKIIGPTVRYKRLRLKPGDVGGMSSSGAELILSRDLRMINRAGDRIELRDAERTLALQSIHRVDNTSGIKHIQGPVRRGDLFLPPDIFGEDGLTLKTEAERYFGRDNLQALGPGLAGSNYKFADANGKINPAFQNQDKESPPTVLNNGRVIFYPSTVFATGIEDGENGPGDAYTEHRLEIAHQTDLVQDVVSELDGFAVQPRRVFIEQVLGTVVGNDPYSSAGLRQYGKLLKPSLWTDFQSSKPGQFKMEAVERTGSDGEASTAACAYLFKINPPVANEENNPFAVAIEKQGKVKINIPRPSVERYPDAQGVSLEANLQGAMKLFVGAASPTNTSMHVTMAGGIKADIGHNTDTGNAIDVTFHCGVSTTYTGNPNENGVALQQDIRGNALIGCSGDSTESVDGSKSITAANLLSLGGERVNISGTSGFSCTASEQSMTIAGKSQFTYGLAVLETIAAGGKITTILAGGEILNILAGAYTTTVAAGATVFNNPAGAFTVNVGAGALTLTSASGAVAITALAGAMALTSGLALTLTAGLAMNLTATTVISLTAPQVLLGGVAAVLGVCRGTPALPPGVPTLDYFLGIPLLGSATIRSI